MGLDRILYLRWIEKVAGGEIVVDDQTLCCNALWTGINRRKLSGMLVWGRTPGNYRLSFAWTVSDSARVDVFVRSLYFRLLFLAEWMTGRMLKIIIIRFLATLFHQSGGAN